MRVSALLFVVAMLIAATNAAPRKDGLRLERLSDGHGNVVYALELYGKQYSNCHRSGAAVVNYLFVNPKSGKRHWLFKEHQECIWRTLYFQDAVAYDITPAGEFDNWAAVDTTPLQGFRACFGTNPCLPLRRIFASSADGQHLVPLTDTFQILQQNDVPNVTQNNDGTLRAAW